MINIRYVEDAVGVASEQLAGFFVGWPKPPSPATHLRLLRASDHIVLALDGTTNAVIGYFPYGPFAHRRGDLRYNQVVMRRSWAAHRSAVRRR
jgi:hypothetical protein